MSISFNSLVSMTLEDRYAVFAALSTVPRGPEEIIDRCGLSSTKTIIVLVQLEEDGLARVHNEQHMEWILNDVG